jgi:hypothetical protein
MNWRTIVATALVLAWGTAFADTVVLKNGRRIEGRLINDNEREVTIETRGGVLMRFERNKVASVEKDAQGPGNVKQGVSEDLGVPDGASDEDVEKLRALVPQLRDTAHRYVEAKKDRENAEKAGSKDVQLYADREKAFAKQLDSLKQGRDSIERSAAERLAKLQKDARIEASQLRADTDKLKAANDAPGLADRGEKLRARVPENAREPRHGPLLGEALYAVESSGEVDELLAKDAKTNEAKVAGYMRAGEHYAWCVENDPSGGDRVFKKAIAAYAWAHRAAGFDTLQIERALLNLQAYKACAFLIEERLGDRRWGAEVAESEAGQYRLQVKDKVVYGNEPPGTPEAKGAQERRERQENRQRKDDKGNTQTILVKVTRWYELTWDARKKHWLRDTEANDVEAKKLLPLLRATQEKADLLWKAKHDLEAAKNAAVERRDALNAARRKVESAEGTEEEFEKATRDAADQAKLVTLAQDGVAQAQVALGAKQREIVELQNEIEKARKGGE